MTYRELYKKRLPFCPVGEDGIIYPIGDLDHDVYVNDSTVYTVKFIGNEAFWNRMIDDEVFWLEENAVSSLNECHCTIQALMRQGCQCGAVKPYLSEKKGF